MDLHIETANFLLARVVSSDRREIVEVKDNRKRLVKCKFVPLAFVGVEGTFNDSNKVSLISSKGSFVINKNLLPYIYNV